ncbi:MAG: alkaline phosphatase [Hydrocarboniphaga sp.]|uniref:alkaline phosphatase D family protein n=1 Tax=Hydrocarboniphaga sp. TaxID=2033016 RepID=UPI002621287D|nr:alkaline phosphatase D family protein [Hydrocarboniphaga sp.]MDB5972944.1 alkaline phosphatase [Hydrocarboniphaga sp.]
MSQQHESSRRRFLKTSAGAAGGLMLGGLPGILLARQAPAVVTSEADRPIASWGLQIGDLCEDRAMIWSRADRASRLHVEWSLDPNFSTTRRIGGVHALETSDFTARVDLSGLPPGREIYLRTTFEALDSEGAMSEPVLGSFRTRGIGDRGVRFVWGGDTCGQGWGINPDDGGMRCYEAMRAVDPDFFLHSGDTIYADGVMAETVALPDGGTWRNAFLDVVPEKTKVAETLQEYHRAYLYNLYDDNVRRFNSQVPQIWQWDDHETLNNWSPGKDLSTDARYTEKRIQTLVGNSTKAFLDYSPMRYHDQTESERVYRKIPYGESLDVFVLDMRSYRGPNTYNLQTEPNADTVYMGKQQIAWLKQQLLKSTATWKIIAADMPLGLQVPDGTDAQGRARFENSSNGDGTVLGREFEIADILRFIKRSGIRNTVWLTADVHYCAAHHYNPDQAQFQDFAPFWEFVAGPLHAGTFGPNVLDNTFGPQLKFQKVPPTGQSNLPPSANYQFFGQIDIDRRTRELTMAFKDSSGAVVYTKSLEPELG